MANGAGGATVPVTVRPDAVTLLCGDAGAALDTLPAQSVHTCITSPSYFGLRDYGCTGQIGLEATPQEYVAALVDVFRGVWRVLRDDGTLFVVLGDSYASGKCGRDDEGPADIARRASSYGTGRPKALAKGANGVARKPPAGLAGKNLLGIPWRVAFALQDDGWILRQELIWHKPNPMPESVKDRCTRGHETVFMLAKGPRYWYDALAVAEDTGPPARSIASGRANGTTPGRPALGPEVNATLYTDNGAADARGRCHLGFSEVSIDGAVTFEAQRFQVVEPVGLKVRLETAERSYVVDLEPTTAAPAAAARVAVTLQDVFAHQRPILAPIPHVAAAPCGAVLASHVGADPPARTFAGAEVVALQGALIAGELFAARLTLKGQQTGTTLYIWSSLAAHNGSRCADGLTSSIPQKRNKRSVWTVATSPLSSKKFGVDTEHYAAFPPELVRPMVRAATSERGVCPQCGAPWRRVVERTPTRPGVTGGISYGGATSAATDVAGARQRLKMRGGGFGGGSAHDAGWQPTCSCGAGDAVPATVLDCFMGSGTTGVVAVQEGRRFVGIDLNRDYLRLAHARIDAVQPPLPVALTI